MRTGRNATTNTWFEAHFTWKSLLVLAIFIILFAQGLSLLSESQTPLSKNIIQFISDIIETIGVTFLGGVVLNFIISKSSFKEDCMDAAANVIADKDLSRFSDRDISEFYAAAVRNYIFRENMFLDLDSDKEYLRDLTAMEESIIQTFCKLHKKSIYMRQSYQNIVIILDDDGACVQAERSELYCMPCGTDFSYKRVIAAMANTSANTYQVKAVKYNGNSLDVEKITMDRNAPEDTTQVYWGYETPRVLSWKFDPDKTEHSVIINSEYRVPAYDVFISYHLKHYCAQTGFDVELRDIRNNKNINFRIATEVFSPTIISSKMPEAKESKRFSRMNNGGNPTHSVRFQTPQETWMEPGSGYAISLDVNNISTIKP